MLLCCSHDCLNSWMMSDSSSQGYSRLLYLCLAKRPRCLCEHAVEVWDASADRNVNTKLKQRCINKQVLHLTLRHFIGDQIPSLSQSEMKSISLTYNNGSAINKTESHTFAHNRHDNNGPTYKHTHTVVSNK